MDSSTAKPVITTPYRLQHGGQCREMMVTTARLSAGNSQRELFYQHYQINKTLSSIKEKDLLPFSILGTDRKKRLMAKISMSAIGAARKMAGHDLEVHSIDTSFEYGVLKDDNFVDTNIHVESTQDSYAMHILRLIASTGSCTPILDVYPVDVSGAKFLSPAFQEFFAANSVQAQPGQWALLDYYKHAHRALKHTGPRGLVTVDIFFKGGYRPKFPQHMHTENGQLVVA